MTTTSIERTMGSTPKDGETATETMEDTTLDDGDIESGNVGGQIEAENEPPKAVTKSIKETVCCPITKKPFKCAVVHPKDGVSYEKESVQERDGDSAYDYYPNRALMEYLSLDTDPQQEVQPSTNERGVFLCPITQDLIRDPVIDPEGNTYERYSIIGWIQQHGASPITRNSLRVEQLYDNTTLFTVLIQEIEQQTEQGLISDDCEEINAWKRDISSPSPYVPPSHQQTTVVQTRFSIQQPRQRIRNRPGHDAIMLQSIYYAAVLIACSMFVLNFIAGVVAVACILLFSLMYFPFILGWGRTRTPETNSQTTD
ncbi:U-box domain-containing protein [Seminavis robusta]|uniref:U-box domain-containing protein n=1 Tax=Seminavis robusta TaxID=568900 RepID=A0A9N8HSX4_9STRA|nr:U-box domain-containing protein [Seminavis robusta]|eukprot:Sro1503_g278040.1 U-box domain-containing protein (313) ;mRNA; r:13529-14467